VFFEFNQRKSPRQKDKERGFEFQVSFPGISPVLDYFIFLVAVEFKRRIWYNCEWDNLEASQQKITASSIFN